MNLALLKEFFAGFLRTRHIARHFRRLALLETLAQTGISHEMPPGLTGTLVGASTADAGTLLQRLDSHKDGLSESQAEAVRARVGLNEVEYEKPLPWRVHLWHCYRNPFNLLLTLLAIISFLTEDVKATIVIGTMVVLSTLLRFWQEAKSNREADALKAMVSNTATVIRRDLFEDAAPVVHRIELPIALLVHGDVIALSAGDMIPADCRVLTAKDLFVSQAAMTGESMPVEKFAVQRDTGTINPLELDNSADTVGSKETVRRYCTIFSEEAPAIRSRRWVSKTGLYCIFIAAKSPQNSAFFGKVSGVLCLPHFMAFRHCMERTRAGTAAVLFYPLSVRMFVPLPGYARKHATNQRASLRKDRQGMCRQPRERFFLRLRLVAGLP